jgi:hypothetical protein
VSRHRRSHGPLTTALVIDVDGVVSPIGGATAWGDDVVAGHVFGPVLVSPALCRALDELAARPGVAALWLTSWTAEMREGMEPFPGRNWPELLSSPDDSHGDWWKWATLRRWLNANPRLSRLAWCDDELTDDEDLSELQPPRHAAEHSPDDLDAPYGRAVIHAELTRRGVDVRLLAPCTTRGLTPTDVALLAAFIPASNGPEPTSPRR